MKATIWLVVDRDGVDRMTRRPPELHRSQGAVRLTISVPDTAFKSFSMAAEVEVAEAQVAQPTLQVTVEDPTAAPPGDDGAAELEVSPCNS